LADLVDLFLLRGKKVLHACSRLIVGSDCSCIQGSFIDMFARLQNEVGDFLLGKEAAVDHPARKKEDGIAFTPESLFLRLR
jgi:hypothetical protein